jgi:serine/threonine-protein kinase
MSEVIAGKYELKEIAGKGGMATVWRALMRGAAGFTRPVALKRILPQLSDNDDFIAMFVEEARVGSELVHPHIVQILDFGVDERNMYFLVMEWVEGIDLGRFAEAHARQGLPTPWPVVTAVVLEALRGLSAAHERLDASGRPAPVIHRDITPQNILIGTNGIAKLTDFGLARAMDRARMTQPDVVKGKLGYLAPEVTMGKPASLKSDIYGMGIVLWEVLAGRRLYLGETDVQIFMAARNAEVPPLAKIRTDLPAALYSAIESALAREPEKRFGSAEQMIRSLAGVLRLVSSTDGFAIAEHVVAARRALAGAAVAR